MRLPPTQTTALCHSTTDDIFVRGKSLCSELIGQLSFTEMFFFQAFGKRPSREQTALIDACLVTLVEHGLTPSVIVTRLVYTSAPESLQGAVAAGLGAVGSLFVGTMEGAGKLLERLVRNLPDPLPPQPLGELARSELNAEAERIVREHQSSGRALAGFGHPLHKPDDPRAIRLLALAREHGVAGRHVLALLTLASAVDRVYGKHITINATGAIAAVLGDCGVPCEILRGFALVARCAGLVGHIHEEQKKPALRALWEAGERAVPYVAEGD